MGWDILHSVERYNPHNGHWEPAERIRVTYETDKYGLAIESVYNEAEYDLCPCQSVRDYAVFEGSHRDDILGRSAEHFVCLRAHRDNRFFLAVIRNHRRLVEHNSASGNRYYNVRCTQIYSDIKCHLYYSLYI